MLEYGETGLLLQETFCESINVVTETMRRHFLNTVMCRLAALDERQTPLTHLPQCRSQTRTFKWHLKQHDLRRLLCANTLTQDQDWAH